MIPLIPIQLAPDQPVIWCKLEFLNPSGSTKDRVARYILEKAMREGRLPAGSTVIEASSGSTSIAMAMVCAQFGMHFIAVMPEGVSSERALMIRAYGGGLRYTPREGGIHAAIAETERLAQQLGAFLPRQFANIENAEAHRFGTGREILEQIPGGAVHGVVSGVGTGGTLVGLFEAFRESGTAVIPFLARPVELSSPMEAECCSFSCKIPGVVESVSTIFREEALPGLRIVEIEEHQAIETTRALIRLGYPVGPSSGLNYRAAERAAKELPPDAKVVTVFPDRMERYFSTELFQPFTP